MKVFDSKNIRNVGFIGHKAAGKTSLAEALLWTAKATPRLGSTAHGTSLLDSEAEEHKRVMSTSTGLGTMVWGQTKINVLDTPGDGNFLADTQAMLPIMDTAITVVSAKDGVEPMTERVFGWASELKLPSLIALTKVDMEGASFERTFQDIKDNLCGNAVLIQMPIGEAHDFRGVIDLLTRKAYFFGDGDAGKVTEQEIPADMAEAAEDLRNTLIEDIATNDETLMEKFFEGILTTEELVAGLRTAMNACEVTPVICASGTLNQGASLLLDFVVQTCPNPLEAGPKAGTTGDTRSLRNPDPDGPLTCFVFKTIVDPHAGKQSIMRVLSGSTTDPAGLKNPRQPGTHDAHLAHLGVLLGHQLEGIDAARTGDIFAVPKLKDVHTGDTLSSDGFMADGPVLPEPLISRALHTDNAGAEDKLSHALERIVEEDLGLTIRRDETSGQIILNGTGLQHLEVSIEKMARKFGVECTLELPRVPYLETFSRPVQGVEGKHKKQSGGSGQFGVVTVDFSPGERGSGLVFEDGIVGGAIPRHFIPSVEKGIHKAMERGIIAGFPVVDLKVRLIDGKHHSVDSKDGAFQLAGAAAFREAAALSHPVLLEPIMDVEIRVPEANIGDVMGDVSTRRGRLSGSETEDKDAIIHAQLPLAEMQTYETALRSMTHGRGSFTMKHSHMEPVPPPVQAQIVKDSGFVAHEHVE